MLLFPIEVVVLAHRRQVVLSMLTTLVAVVACTGHVAFTLRRYRHLFARQRKGAAFGMSELVRAEHLDRTAMPTELLRN
jgi:hypothetical protein